MEVAFTEGTLNRRNALMRFIDACGCEVEYDGYAINLRKHRGSTARKVLMDGENVTDLSVTLDSREDTAAYEISLFKMADLQAGDEVNITYTPMGIDVDTRIVSITYNPFYRYAVRVEVGDYVPNLLASTSTQLDRIRQEFRAADGRMESTIETIDGEMSELRQIWNGIQIAFTALGGFLGWFLGGADGFLYALIAFVVIDYITGVMCAISDKSLSSEVGFRGICRKVLIFILVGIGNLLDVYILGEAGV